MIRPLKASDTPQVERLWALCFSDTQEELDGYFSNLYVPEECLGDFEGEQLLAMVQGIPTALLVGDLTVPAWYLYGVCTHPDFRRQGRMARLLQEIHQRAEQAGCGYTFLKPENPSVYTPFGYRTTAFYESGEGVFKARPATLSDTPKWDELNEILAQVTASHKNLRSDRWWEQIKACYGNVRTLYEGGVPVAYAVFDETEVLEVVACTPSAKELILGSISNGERITYRTVGKNTPYAMTRPIGKHPPLDEAGYMGLLFD